MSVLDPKTGYRRNLTYDETLNLIEDRDANAGAKAGPGINREATRFVQSPFFERLQAAAYEDMRQQQVKQNLIQQNQAREREAAQQMGVPPEVVRHIPGPPPPGPPDGSSGSADRFTTPDARPSASFRNAASSEPGPRPGGRGPPRSRSPRRKGPGDDMDDDPDVPPDVPPAAGAVAIPQQFAGVTPQVMAQVNQTRLEAELRQLAQQTEQANARAAVAQSVANALHAQRVNDPIFLTSQGPPPAPPTIQVQTLDPSSVAAAMQQAMREERRTIAEMMHHHGKSMKQIVQDAVTNHSAQPAQPMEVTQNTPASEQTARPSVKAIKKMFEKKTGKKVTIKVVPEVGGATAPMPTPASSSNDVPEPTVQLKRGVKRQIDPDDPWNMEDLAAFERSRSNPSARLATAKKAAQRRAMLEQRPVSADTALVAGKRKATSQLVSDRTPAQPAPLSQTALREAARKVLSAYAQQQQRQSKQEAADIFRRGAGQPIRMDQFDNKRTYEDMVDQLEQKARTRPRTAGRTLNGFTVTLPSRTAVA